MADEHTRKVRFPLLLSEEEVKQLDDWQFSRRIRSRGEAIRQVLLQAGVLKARPESAGKRGRPAAAAPEPSPPPAKPKRGSK